MTILLDTHVLLWMLNEPERLSASQRVTLAQADHRLMVSTVTLAEISIKYGNRKLGLPAPPEEFFPPYFVQSAIEILPLLAVHAYLLHKLPHHHKDPFDRMLIAQATAEKLPLMTSDKQFKAYGIKLMK